jgi:hypothetical protein
VRVLFLVAGIIGTPNELAKIVFKCCITSRGITRILVNSFLATRYILVAFLRLSFIQSWTSYTIILFQCRWH